MADECGALRLEGALGGLDLHREAIDGDEEAELARAQRVEDLAVIATRPYGRPVRDEPQPREIISGVGEVPDGSANPRDREARVEQRTDHPQRHEVTEPVATLLGRGGDEAVLRPVADLGDRAAGQTGCLRRSEAHRFRRRRRDGTARATGCPHRKGCGLRPRREHAH